MKPKTKKILITSVVIATVGITGLAIRYFYRKWKEEQDKKKGEGTPPPVYDTPTETGGGSGSGGGRTNKECRKQNPFPTKLEVENFQKWVLSKYGQILGKSGADGDFGCLTLDAWQKYGSLYKPNSGTSTNTNTSEIYEAKQKIIDFFKGDKAWIKQNLGYHTDGFILEWAKNVDKFNNNNGAYGSAFVYKNQVYIVHDGSRVLTTNPIDKQIVKAKDSILLRSLPESKPPYSQTWSMPNMKIGKVVNVYWNNTEKRLYYITDRQNYIWVLASDVKFA